MIRKKSDLFLFLIYALSGLAAFTSLIYAETYYVKSFVIRPLAKPDYSSVALGELHRGKSVEKIEEKDNWTKVRFGVLEGWLPTIALSQTPPGEHISVLAGRDEISSQARRRASNFANTLAARGLVENGRARLSGQLRPNIEAVARMERQQKTSEAEAVEFMSVNEK